MDEHDDWITVTEAAAILGVHKVSVGYRMRRGLLTCRIVKERSAGDGKLRPHAYYLRHEVEAMAAGPPPFAPRAVVRPFLFSPTATECAYLAGLTDGEGCIRIYRLLRRKATQADHYGIMMQVSNTKPEMLYWIALHFGGRVSRLRREHERWAGCYDWKAHNIAAFHVLKSIEPFLITKASQARLAIRFQERMMALPGGNRPITAAETSVREAMFEEMSFLNKRGPR